MTISLVLIMAGFILLSIAIATFTLPGGADAPRHPEPPNETDDQ
ncbi:hypothetical protein AB0L63_14705 [Nocardia sp. NPDC051990]